MKLISAILFACVAAVALLHSVYGTTLPISASDAVPEPGPESKPKTEPFPEPQAAPNATVGEIEDNGEAAAGSLAIMPPLPSSFVELSANPDALAKSPAPSESNAYVGSLDDMVQDMTAETLSN
ncbi:hypothetical protein ACLKA7_002565 [Drosophila subpalustris]